MKGFPDFSQSKIIALDIAEEGPVGCCFVAG
jgi:hypothetical protein